MLSNRKLKDGYYHFYWNGQDITGLWMDFFSGLTMGQERTAHLIFTKRYQKRLNELYGKPTNRR